MSFSKLPTNAAVIYEGPSLLDGKPVVVIATTSGRNRKTGAVVQTYILRSDIDPREASKTGEDFSICGNCSLKGKATDDPAAKTAKERECYVRLDHGPLVVWKSYKKGTVYPTIRGHEAIAALGAGKVVRLGSYGDPSAVPSYLWDSLLSGCTSHLGYTHQNSIPGADVRPDQCMTSAESEEQARAAWDRGERTFRVVTDYSRMVPGKEIACPSDTRGVQCADCRLCGGTSVSGKNIAIVAHGKGAALFSDARAA